MREILFRGRISKNEWVYGLPIEGEPLMGGGKETCIVTKPGLSYYDGVLMTYDECVEVDPDTVGQFTGLTDKNGTKIFEGDIVRYGDTIHRVVFEQRNGTAYFGLVYAACETLPFGHYQDLKQIEVIGNIYDNPELQPGTAGGEQK
jgi:hypothetical protein|nr:MAG TPA: YopX protein [Caudoviricetes sp.]